jgi:hypothetical protein
MGRARTGGWLGVVIIAVAVTGGGGDAESAEDVVSCFEDAELTEVEDGEVSDAEDIGALEEAAGEEADGFVSSGLRGPRRLRAALRLRGGAE